LPGLWRWRREMCAGEPRCLAAVGLWVAAFLRRPVRAATSRRLSALTYPSVALLESAIGVLLSVVGFDRPFDDLGLLHDKVVIADKVRRQAH